MKKCRLPRKLKKRLKGLNGGKLPSKGDILLINRMNVYELHFYMGRAGRRRVIQEAIENEILFMNGSRIALGSDRPPIGQLKWDNLGSFWANNGVECYEPKVIRKVSNIFE